LFFYAIILPYLIEFVAKEEGVIIELSPIISGLLKLADAVVMLPPM